MVFKVVLCTHPWHDLFPVEIQNFMLMCCSPPTLRSIFHQVFDCARPTTERANGAASFSAGNALSNGAPMPRDRRLLDAALRSVGPLWVHAGRNRHWGSASPDSVLSPWCRRSLLPPRNIPSASLQEYKNILIWLCFPYKLSRDWERTFQFSHSFGWNNVTARRQCVGSPENIS